jgi:YidC/Oxa1 family membrane protein insertase
MPNQKNVLLATILSFLILISWTWFYEKPKIEKREAKRKIEKSESINSLQNSSQINKQAISSNNQISGSSDTLDKKNDQQSKNIISAKSRQDIIKESQQNRIIIKTDNLHGSINLEGALFDDLTLAQYYQEIERKNEVYLFSPTNSKERYFADFGWISNSNIDLPNPKTIWQSDKKELLANQSAVLKWKNKQEIEFIIKISLDENYLFSIEQKVINHSKNPIQLASWGRINRIYNSKEKPVYILHEGGIGEFNNLVNEVSYKDLIEENKKEFDAKNGGWLGITDKYWLSSILVDKKLEYKAEFSHQKTDNNNFFTTQFISNSFILEENQEFIVNNHLFAGAKKVSLLDQYSKKYDLKLFDRAIDFGWFYFLTKPLFFLIELLSKLLGNFGLAILAMTVLLKAALFPMANKSYIAIDKIKKLQPKIEKLKENFKNDRVAMNREMMELYKKEKVNPASGCLPLLIQIPVFFALYKVLYVTLDMRHAEFYGWIKDLSAPDPTSIFNLFGILPYEVSTTFTIGAWPILMGITMIIQQKLSPPTSDPTQAKVLKWMPYILTFVLAAFPAGLVIYWTWSNILSILQQWFITKRLSKK